MCVYVINNINMYKYCNLSPGFGSRLRSQSLREGSIYVTCRDLRNYRVYISVYKYVKRKTSNHLSKEVSPL